MKVTVKDCVCTTNDNPCISGFIPIHLGDGVELTNQNNSCATEDNGCGGVAVENSLWYTFTLGAGFDRITINVTGLTSPSIGVYDVVNPCNQTPVNEECNGDGIVDFNCLPSGTYTIMVGSSADNAGLFSIIATQGNNVGPANDFCTDATELPGQPYDLCVELGPFDASSVNSCPETLPTGEIFGACDFNTQETSWYVFTAPGAVGDMLTMDFTYTGYSGTGTPFMNVFELGSDCSVLNAIDTNCFQGLNSTFNIGTLISGQRYLIAISSLGDTGGDFEYTLKFNLGPAYCDCPEAIITFPFQVITECLKPTLNSIPLTFSIEGDIPNVIPTINWSGGESANAAIDNNANPPIFDPKIAGVGNHVLLLTYTQNSCTWRDEILINIIESEEVILNNDTMYLDAGVPSSINIFENDNVPSDPVDFILNFEEDSDVAIVDFDSLGNITVQIVKELTDDVVIRYTVCDRCDICTDGKIILINNKLKDIVLTTLFTPKENTNNTLQFSEEPITGSELWIYNRWGQEIFHIKDYENDWNGDGYPGGVYFYVLDVYGIKIKKTLTVVK